MRNNITLSLALLALLAIVYGVVPISGGSDGMGHLCGSNTFLQQQMESGFELPTAGLSSSVLGSGRVVHHRLLTEETYKNLRVGVFSEDLADPKKYCVTAGQVVDGLVCSADDVLTPEKRQILLTIMLPKAIQLHSERLKVKRVIGSIVVPNVVLAPGCSFFTIPEAHHTTGVEGYDFILYISAKPTEGNLAAWAVSCAADTEGRPVVGVTNIGPMFINTKDTMARVVAHELAHALGFNAYAFVAAGMIAFRRGARDKPDYVELISPRVVAAGASFFAYPSLSGVELEDEGGSGTAFSHWKRRNMKNELMAGALSATMYYTALTLAAFEDLGYYVVDYSKAEVMPWGYHAGESFLTEKCVIDGVSPFPSMFCTNGTVKDACAEDRLGIGYCGMKTYQPNTIPEYEQYFSDPNLGGLASFVDYCPIIIPGDQQWCDSRGVPDLMPGSLLSASSLCLDAVEDGLTVSGNVDRIRSVCAQIRCGSGVEEGKYDVMFAGSSSWVSCPVGGEVRPSLYSRTFTDGAVRCPPYVEVCSRPYAIALPSESVNAAVGPALRLVPGEYLKAIGWSLLLIVALL